MMEQPAHFLHSGEFHYFRVRKALWQARLAQMRDIGLNAVSIYIPWNWHEALPGEMDLTGQTVPERDLLGALDAIARSGLKCIFRPGPYITAEWRGGGIPAWLWEQNPQVLTLTAWGQPPGIDSPYPAITYDHPVFRSASRRWLESLFGPVTQYLQSRGGPIVNIQLEDEPSYWHLLENPLLADFNPVLVSPGDGTSLYARWLLQRHGSLQAVNLHQGTQFESPADIDPPREPVSSPQEFARHQDWLDFKLSRIDEYVAFLADVLRGCGVDVTLSMLYPYLRSVLAGKFTDFICQRGLNLELTDECYATLFATNGFAEHKIGHIVTTHETYHMWRGSEFGPPVCMELQGSNASYLTPTAMEVLYKVTIARGIRGVNYYMFVGGENPPGFENMTGREYDIWAALSPGGEERPHAGVIRRLARLLDACRDVVMTGEPLRDIWLGYYTPYEAASLVGGEGIFASAAAVMKQFFSTGDNGTTDALALQSLLAISSISYGCLDLERVGSDTLAGVRQLWLYSLDFMSAGVQKKLLAYVQNGGHLVIMPCLPRLDEHMQPCSILAQAIFGGEQPPSFWQDFTYMRNFTAIEGRDGESLVAMGRATTFDLPRGASAIAISQRDGKPCGFESTIGCGRVTVLGFPLQYVPAASPAQKDFVTGIVERTTGRRFTAATHNQFLAMEMAGRQSALVCLVNPVNLPGQTCVEYTLPGSGAPARLPLVLQGMDMPGQGARLLPVEIPLGGDAWLRHATWELVGCERVDGAVTLLCAAQPGSRGELALRGALRTTSVTGAETTGTTTTDGLTILVLTASGDEVTVRVEI